MREKSRNISAWDLPEIIVTTTELCSNAGVYLSITINTFINLANVLAFAAVVRVQYDTNLKGKHKEKSNNITL